MDSILYKFEILKDKEDVAWEWLEFLKNNKENATASLKDEDGYYEGYFVSEEDDILYVYMHMICEDVEKAKEIAYSSNSDFDKKHFGYLKECVDLTKGKILTSVVDFVNFK